MPLFPGVYESVSHRLRTVTPNPPPASDNLWGYSVVSAVRAEDNLWYKTSVSGYKTTLRALTQPSQTTFWAPKARAWRVQAQKGLRKRVSGGLRRAFGTWLQLFMLVGPPLRLEHFVRRCHGQFSPWASPICRLDEPLELFTGCGRPSCLGAASAARESL